MREVRVHLHHDVVPVLERPLEPGQVGAGQPQLPRGGCAGGPGGPARPAAPPPRRSRRASRRPPPGRPRRRTRGGCPPGPRGSSRARCTWAARTRVRGRPAPPATGAGDGRSPAGEPGCLDAGAGRRSARPGPRPRRARTPRGTSPRSARRRCGSSTSAPTTQDRPARTAVSGRSTRPWGSTIALSPEIAAWTIHRPVSTARIWLMITCSREAGERRNEESFVETTISLGPVAHESPERGRGRRSRSRSASPPGIPWHVEQHPAMPGRPGRRCPVGTSGSTRARDGYGMYSPNGTRWIFA